MHKKRILILGLLWKNMSDVVASTVKAFFNSTIRFA